MLNNIGWDGRLHRWRGSKTCSQAYLSEAGSPQIFSLWVVHTSYGTMILVRFQSLLLLSNSFLILVSEYVTDNFNHSKDSCVCRS